MFIFLNFSWGIAPVDNFILTELNTLFEGYKYYYCLDIASTVKDTEGLLADSSYRQTILKEWGDDAHPNSNGSNRIYKYISKYLFNEFNETEAKELTFRNNSIVSSKSKIEGVANYSLVIGDNCNATRPYGITLGNNGKNENSSVVFGRSADSSKIRQFDRDIRSTITSNNSEVFLRDGSSSAFFTTQPNCIIDIKGYISAYSATSNTHKELKLDCKLISNSSSPTIVSDTGFVASGVTNEEKGSLAVTARVVASASNSISIRVTGLSGETVYWTSMIEINQITIA